MEKKCAREAVIIDSFGGESNLCGPVCSGFYKHRQSVVIVVDQCVMSYQRRPWEDQGRQEEFGGGGGSAPIPALV